MFFQYNFQTHCNFDEPAMEVEPDLKQSSFPTSVNNSPGSVKSLDCYSHDLQHSCDVSFEEGTQVNHASQIWSASVDLLSNSMNSPFNPDTAFNDNELYQYSSYYPEREFKNIDEAIKGSRLLRFREKSDFIQSMQQETQLCGLLIELMALFNQKIFGEVLYIIHTIWNQKYLPYRERRKKNANSIIPKFSCFFGFQEEEKNVDQVWAEDKDSAQISEEAQDNVEHLARELFNSKRLKYLNLQEVWGAKKGGKELREQFEQFVKAVSKAVFLSAEGIYEEEVSIASFSEDEMGLFGNSGNAFVRPYSQISQEDDEFCVQAGTKRQKLF